VHNAVIARAPAKRTIARWAAACSTALILLLTLMPRPGGRPDECGPLDLFCGATAAVDFVLNVALFLPLGLSLAAGGARPRAAGAVALGLSLLVELLQLAAVPGRAPSLRDLLANAAGGLAGAGVGRAWRGIAAPPPGCVSRVTGGAAVALGGLLLASAHLLQPSFPPAVWYGQHRAELGGYDRFEGRLLSARLAGLPLPSGPFDRSDVLPRLRSEGLSLEAAITRPRGASRRVAPIASIFDGEQRKLVLLGQLGDGLAFSPRVRGEDYT
jgi:VanZ family protein